MTIKSNVIDHKLLCASSCAYYVDLSGKFVPPLSDKPKQYPDYCLYKDLDIIGKVHAFVNNSTLLSKINAAIIIEIDEAYILAFRGTLPFSTKHHDLALLEDWGEDLFGSNLVSRTGLPGKVHEGFADAFNTIWSQILEQLEIIYQKNNAQKPLYITGHSKGGPMASYAAYRCNNSNIDVAGISTFASPFSGDADFAKAYNKVIDQTRYEYHLDIVPFLPPQQSLLKTVGTDIDLFMILLEVIFPQYRTKFKDVQHMIAYLETINYKSVGTLKYINYLFQIESDSPTLEAIRIKQFKKTIKQEGIKEGLKTIGHSHSIGCSGGYQKGCYPGACDDASLSSL